MTDKIYSISEIKNIISLVAKEYDVERISIFGSYARGEADNNSDLDLYVENFSYKPFHSIFNFMARMEESFNKKVDIITDTSEQFIRDKYDKALFENIKKEKVICYERK